jgi:diguanylate cyclase (GGDEF)-like protein/PAS domain S-box-containing protein
VSRGRDRRRLEAEAARRRRLETELAESRDLLSFLGETTGVLYRLRYADMTYQYLSPAVERLTGYTPEEIQKLGFARVVKAITEPAAEEVPAEAIRSRRLAGVTGEYRADYLVETKDGGRRWLADHSTPWRDSKGEVIGSLGVLVDITHRKRLEESLRVMATMDQLTGVANRRHFMDLAEREAYRAQRYGHDLSLVMIDLDHFKRINDTHGHAAGDRVLEEVCRVCGRELRESDLLGRMGGEEFAALLVECGLDEALAAAERLRRAVASRPVEGPEGAIRVTLSLGAAQLRPSESLSELLGRADRALYAAKRAGRDRVAAEPPAGDHVTNPQ